VQLKLFFPYVSCSLYSTEGCFFSPPPLPSSVPTDPENKIPTVIFAFLCLSYPDHSPVFFLTVWPPSPIFPPPSVNTPERTRERDYRKQTFPPFFLLRRLETYLSSQEPYVRPLRSPPTIHSRFVPPYFSPSLPLTPSFAPDTWEERNLFRSKLSHKKLVPDTPSIRRSKSFPSSPQFLWRCPNV